MTINELVAGEVVSIDPAASLTDAAVLMQDMGVGSVAVVVDDALEGIFTERDILQAVASGVDFDTSPVSSFMTLLPDAFGPEMSVNDAADWMLATGYRHLPVVDGGGGVLGMVSIKDILWAITDPATV